MAGNGSCAVAGQTVTCTINGLATGQSAPVNIIVTPTAAKSYSNTATVAPAGTTTDPGPANNSASATLTAAAAPSPAPTTTTPPPSPARCVVPRLTRTPLAVAKRVLVLLGCKVGKTNRARSRTVANGSVIRTAPGAGTYASGKAVGLRVSSGAPKKRSS